MSHFLLEGNYTQVVCIVVCYLAVKRGQGRKNELTLQRVEMRMTRWMCGVKITDRFSSSELREILGIDDIITK